jgi:hypothetical protein
MPPKTPAEAVGKYVSYLTETLSVITSDCLKVFPPSKNLIRIGYIPLAPVRLASGRVIYISIAQMLGTQALQDGTYKVKTREYSYILREDNVPSTHGCVSYHWHPEKSALRSPHLHIHISPQVGYPELELRIHRAHYPTSRVCLEDFVRLLVDYYDVKARLPRSEWDAILKKNKRAFEKGATWMLTHKTFQRGSQVYKSTKYSIETS